MLSRIALRLDGACLRKNAHINLWYERVHDVLRWPCGGSDSLSSLCFVRGADCHKFDFNQLEEALSAYFLTQRWEWLCGETKRLTDTDDHTMGNCSSMLTKQCLGLSVPRYDPNASNDLIDQDALWKQYAGFWGPFTERRNTLSDDNAPRQPSFYNPMQKVGWPYQSDVFTSYRRVTFLGTRYKSEKFYFYKPASEEFCSQT